MKRYLVLVEGGNLWMAVDRLAKYGFFTTRFVKAHDPNEALEIAKNLIMNELISNKIKKNEPNDPVIMKGDEIRVIGWWQYLRHAPGKGFSFFLEDERESDELFTSLRKNS